MTGDAPSRCPEHEILKLQASEIDGLVQLAHAPPPRSARRFAEGERVRIKLGAFDGREARYVRASKRNMSTVTVVLLNRAILVQVPTVALAAIAAA
jgi:transcription antitermination factor NusG